MCYNITAAWAVDREFEYTDGPVVPSFVAFWVGVGLPLAPLGSLWGGHWRLLGRPWLPLAPFECLWGSHCQSFGSHWGPLAFPGVSLGSLGAQGSIWAPFSEEMLLKYRACAQNQAARYLPGLPGLPGSSAETGYGTAARTPPSHAPGARMT